MCLPAAGGLAGDARQGSQAGIQAGDSKTAWTPVGETPQSGFSLCAPSHHPSSLLG